MSDGEDIIVEQVARDTEHFKALLNLVNPQAFFNQESKDEIWGNATADPYDDEDGESDGRWFHKKKKGGVSFSTMTMTQIAEMRLQGQTFGDLKKKNHKTNQSSDNTTQESSLSAKQEGKKKSRTPKNKNKAKELERREARLEELKQRLQTKVEEIKARKNAGKPVSSQEQKKLKREQKRVNAKLKQKNKNHKVEPPGSTLAEGLKSPPQSKIVNQNGTPVRSKFDFSIISFGKDKSKSSDLQGRDYNRLLEKVEKRKEKVAALKEKDPEAGKKLEEKIQWQTVISKAQGEKVKDDPTLLKRALKRKDKVKDKRQKKWGDRKKTVEEAQKKKCDKREANLNKRKSDNKDNKKKKLIKRGRLVPGF